MKKYDLWLYFLFEDSYFKYTTSSYLSIESDRELIR